jgi:hypothetical protein
VFFCLTDKICDLLLVFGLFVFSDGFLVHVRQVVGEQEEHHETGFDFGYEKACGWM